MANKVRYGLRKAYYSVVTMDGTTPTFATPVALPGAVSITLEPQGDSADFYADDGVYFSQYANNGYEGTLELAMIPDSFLKDCLGMEMDDDDVLIESTDNTPSNFALLFEFTADTNAIRHVLYYCTASRPTQDGDTKGESIEVKTEELSFKALPLPGSMAVKGKSTPDTDSTEYNAWYTTVHVPSFPELTVSPETATYNDEDVVLTVTGGTVDTVRLSGAEVDSDNYTVNGTSVTIKSTYLDTLTTGLKRFRLLSGTKDCVFKLTIPETE